jgi:hypothetical protein
MQQWTHIKEDSDPADLNLGLAVDAELFRLDSVVRWLDAADARIKRARADHEPAGDANPTSPEGNIQREANIAAEGRAQWRLPGTHVRTRR